MGGDVARRTDLPEPGRAPEPERRGRPPAWTVWLLLLPYVGLLWVPFYNQRDPVLLGFPFFYWYQFAWVPLTALLTWLAYRSVRDDED